MLNTFVYKIAKYMFVSIFVVLKGSIQAINLTYMTDWWCPLTKTIKAFFLDTGTVYDTSVWKKRLLLLLLEIYLFWRFVASRGKMLNVKMLYYSMDNKLVSRSRFCIRK